MYHKNRETSKKVIIPPCFINQSWPVCVFSSTDIDECSEKAGLCGEETVCSNTGGTFYCSCPKGYIPSTGIMWEMGVTYCQSEYS